MTTNRWCDHPPTIPPRHPCDKTSLMDVMLRACSPAHPLETEALRPMIFGCVHSPRAAAVCGG